MYPSYAIILQNHAGSKEHLRLQSPLDAYLDIETTGLCFYRHEITVIGIYLVQDKVVRLVQLVGSDINRANLLESLCRVATVYTYNGSRFDLPFISSRLGVDLTEAFGHHDLMHDCWMNRLYGGFKAVERRLGIDRHLQGIGGVEAVSLWWRYRNHNDKKALDLLLEYNREDVVNLMALREKLAQLKDRTLLGSPPAGSSISP